MNPPVIERPDRVGRVRSGIWHALTLVLWIFYSVLWVPLITLVAWILGVHTAWARLYQQQNAVDPFVLASLPIIALMCAIVVIGWSRYNQLRAMQYGNRRERPLDVSDKAVALRLQAAPEIGDVLRHRRIVRVTLDDKAAPVAAEDIEAGVASNGRWQDARRTGSGAGRTG